MTQTVAELTLEAARQVGEIAHNQTIDPDSLVALWPTVRDFLNGLAAHVTGTSEALFEQAVAGATQLYGGNVRLLCSASCTVTLPAAPKDGWRVIAAYVASGQTLTLAPNGRLIAGATANVTVSAAATGEWLYRADLADWRSPLVTAVTDTVPWPDDTLRGLAAMLAIEIQPALGLPLKPDTRAAAATAEQRMVNRYHRKAPELFRGWRYQQQGAAA